MTTPAHAAIEHHAYHLWQQEGRQDGQALDHWLRAEAALASVETLPHDRPAKPGGHPPSVMAAEVAARRQRSDARAPERPRRGTTDRAEPAESGKPIWPTPASS
jgi:hypothetical protein